MRSVEIPDETTFAAIRAFDGKQGYSKLERMRAALEAALPYLVPAVDREEALVVLLTKHRRANDDGYCACGFAPYGVTHAEHVAALVLAGEQEQVESSE